MTITREEFEARMKDIKTDLGSCGIRMREQMANLKRETREDFKSVWRAMDGMLLKVGVVVTITTSIVMALFQYIGNK